MLGGIYPRYPPLNQAPDSETTVESFRKKTIRGVTLTASPHDDGSVGVSGQDVPVLRERQARHVLRTVAGRFEYSVPLVQGVSGV